MNTAFVRKTKQTTARPPRMAPRAAKTLHIEIQVKCECGQVATHAATFLQFNSAGQEMINEIRLCAACYAELVTIDRNLLTAGALLAHPGAHA